MAGTTHTCDGCHAELRFKDDLSKVGGGVRPAWRCAYCQTTVPSVVAERIKHQER